MKALTSPFPFSMTLPTWANKHNKIARHIMLVLVGSWLIALCAKLSVPFYPVPITMQTFAVMLIGALYGWRLGGMTLLAYLGQGLMGLPVFAGLGSALGIGYVYMMGPTGGYLVGFVFAAMAMGWAVHRSEKAFVPSFILGYILSNIAIFGLGILWLSRFTGDLGSAVQAGFFPFILGDILKGGLVFTLLLVAGQIKRSRT